MGDDDYNKLPLNHSLHFSRVTQTSTLIHDLLVHFVDAALSLHRLNR